jgi:hypothetical protein
MPIISQLVPSKVPLWNMRMACKIVSFQESEDGRSRLYIQVSGTGSIGGQVGCLVCETLEK